MKPQLSNGDIIEMVDPHYLECDYESCHNLAVVTLEINIAHLDITETVWGPCLDLCGTHYDVVAARLDDALDWLTEKMPRSDDLYLADDKDDDVWWTPGV